MAPRLGSIQTKEVAVVSVGMKKSPFPKIGGRWNKSNRFGSATSTRLAGFVKRASGVVRSSATTSKADLIIGIEQQSAEAAVASNLHEI